MTKTAPHPKSARKTGRQLKPRIYSPLERSPQREALLAWLMTGGPDKIGIPYKEAKARLQAEFGLKASTTALANFHHRHLRSKPSAPVETTFEADKITIVVHLRQCPPSSGAS
jgi:hypothetical protein